MTVEIKFFNERKPIQGRSEVKSEKFWIMNRNPSIHFVLIAGGIPEHLPAGRIIEEWAALQQPLCTTCPSLSNQSTSATEGSVG